MMERFDTIKKHLTELATVLNGFKSEAVQLRIVELVFGEDLGEKVSNSPHRSQKDTSGRKGRPKKAKASAAGRVVKKKAAARHGAVATLNQLVSANFFDKPRTIGDLIDHSKHNLARTFKANEFSGTLARLVRDGKLTRKKNADNQYEYKKP